MNRYHIASVSWGKDSTYMLTELIRKGYSLDEALYFDTGMEFEAVYRVRDQVLPLLREHGIRYTELKLEHPFEYYMFDREVRGRKGIHYGQSWCGGSVRWGTYQKVRAMDRYAEERNAQVISALPRTKKKGSSFGESRTS